ncbi:MAG: hypothetical protein E6K78_11490 [Candidatus Eisenbacteria bacterium]|uniref:JAB domain-containing protein n=1 Tax=Eiseniibacteriota bacterium TaxID=2212470 RepID=A0A538TFY8_UNCEI|nr:MAG: hypothetical protein E6K78_11490 [Candidatus Eisenbacteria bacterium]
MTGMFIALRTFTARTSGGRPFEILEGITRIAPGHEFIAKFPDAFAAMESGFNRDELEMAITAAHASGDRETLAVLQRKYRSLADRGSRSAVAHDEDARRDTKPVRSTSSTPAAARVGRPSEPAGAAAAPRIRWRAGNEVVRVSSFAWSQIGWETQHAGHGHETGGALLVDDGGRIAHATGPGPDAHMGPGFISLDANYVFGVERSLHDLGLRYSFAGRWHSHPRAGGLPSSADVDNLAACAELLERELGDRPAVALIATAYSEDFRAASLYAYAARCDPITRVVEITTAKIVEVS